MNGERKILFGIILLFVVASFFFVSRQETVDLISKNQEGVMSKVGEDLIQYTPDSKKVCSSGSCIAEYSASRKYYLENSTWKEINSTFYYNGTSYISDGNNFKVYVTGNKVTIKGENESEVYFRIPTSIAPSVYGNVVSYDISTSGAVKL